MDPSDYITPRLRQALIHALGGREVTPGDAASTEKLMRYWAEGEGAAKIGWGTAGDFNRCRSHLGKYVGPTVVDGLCANLHHRATGAWPGHAPTEQKAGAMADLKGVEIARIGEWSLKSGKLDVTEAMLIDAAAYANRANARSAALKIGHGDPRFDGEPALGWLENLRVEGSGDDAVLIGDLNDMPAWLAEAAPKHWPDRSMEGWTNYEADDGRTYAMVVDGLALLGVQPPGMSSLRSLRDLPQALGVAASTRMVASAPEPVLANMVYHFKHGWIPLDHADGPGLGAAKKVDPGEVQDGDTLHVPKVIGSGTNVYHVRKVHAAKADGTVNVDVTDQTGRDLELSLMANHKVSIVRGPGKKTAATAAQQLPTASAGGPNKTEGGSAVAFSDEQIKNLRAKLQLPETADEAAIVAAIGAVVDESLEERPPGTPTAVTPPPAATPPATPPVADQIQPIAAGPGTMVIDAAAWQAREDSIARLEASEVKRRTEERDEVITKAISAGKFPPVRREHWTRLWDADPEGARMVIAGLTPNVVPVDQMGELGSGEDSIDEEYAHLFPPTPKAV